MMKILSCFHGLAAYSLKRMKLTQLNKFCPFSALRKLKSPHRLEEDTTLSLIIIRNLTDSVELKFG